eukprot:m.480118 g.480118  ORF g.480118 m.480118 type:complete len:291 (+) comp21704_c0_seq1:85-957(+)
MSQAVKMAAKLISSTKCFGGQVKVFQHASKVLNCEMKFSTFVPPQAESGPVPVLYFLSGLTCNETNFITKAGAQRPASKRGLMLVCPDTSPRGVKVEGDEDSWDFGTGAGFYVDATTDGWKDHYKMYSYITEELPALVNELLPADPERISITGHSMGGHGALISALKNPGMYKSVSAFAPICHPSACPWGKKAFTGYLGTDEDVWAEYDATKLVAKYNGPPLHIKIDQGLEDGFLGQNQLLPDDFFQAAKSSGVGVALAKQEGYDHSYYFISTFIEEHIDHHARVLGLME